MGVLTPLSDESINWIHKHDLIDMSVYYIPFINRIFNILNPKCGGAFMWVCERILALEAGNRKFSQWKKGRSRKHMVAGWKFRKQVQKAGAKVPVLHISLG
jgi:hypothetical protein